MPPAHRLPALYLMDSISKNIGSPYTELWAPRIVALFMESYRVVDQPTRRRMEDLLATWRNAGVNGRPLYGDQAQQTIERSLFGSSAAAQGPNRQQVMANLERLLALQTQALARHPGDPKHQQQMDTLQALRTQVHASEPTPSLWSDVQQQLDEVNRIMSGEQPSAAPAPAASNAPAAPTAASELIANLMKAGLLPSASAAPATAPAVAADKTYIDALMALDLKMTTLDLAKPAPEMELLLQDHLPLSCRQCANRYPQGEAGKRSLDAHLDWHFSQNRRARASAARGQSRVWLDVAPHWVRSGFDDSVSAATRNADDHDDPAQDLALRAKIEKSYVLVPRDADVAAQPCRICKEPFQSEWSEDEEEWVWRNAVLVDQVYYHASCFHSAKTMSSTVTAERPAAAAASDAPSDALSPAPAHEDEAPIKAEPDAATETTSAVASLASLLPTVAPAPKAPTGPALDALPANLGAALTALLQAATGGAGAPGPGAALPDPAPEASEAARPAPAPEAPTGTLAHETPADAVPKPEVGASDDATLKRKASPGAPEAPTKRIATKLEDV